MPPVVVRGTASSCNSLQHQSAVMEPSQGNADTGCTGPWAKPLASRTPVKVQGPAPGADKHAPFSPHAMGRCGRHPAQNAGPEHSRMSVLRRDAPLSLTTPRAFGAAPPDGGQGQHTGLGWQCQCMCTYNRPRATLLQVPLCPLQSGSVLPSIPQAAFTSSGCVS